MLAQTGQRTYPCGEEEDIAKCLETVDTNAWTSYSNFYTHTHNMCHFLKSQQWQELTQHTIGRLSDTSAQTVDRLEQSQQLQQQIAAGQQQSLDYHRQMIENGTYLSQAIEASRGNVKEMMDEFKLSTMEQRNMIFEVFDRVSRLQNLVVSEVSWFYTLVFYSFCLLIIYLVTATKRTADARLWLFLILSANFGLERLVVKLSLPDEVQARASNMDVEMNELINQRVWMVRNCTVLVCFVTLVLTAIRFKDYNLINNKLLEDIQRQNLELKRYMETSKLENKNSYHQTKLAPGYYDTLDGLGQLKLREMLEEDAGWQGGDEDEEFSDNDSEDSFNSTRSDRTFNPEDFSTAAGSRETTPTPLNDINLALENLGNQLGIKFLSVIPRITNIFSVVSTPLKPSNEIPQLSHREDDILQSSSSIPILNNSLNSSRYNLRPRSRASNSSILSVNTTMSESPVKSQQVSKLKNISNRNKSKIEQEMERNSKRFDVSSLSEQVAPQKSRRKLVKPKTIIKEEYSADED